MNLMDEVKTLQKRMQSIQIGTAVHLSRTKRVRINQDGLIEFGEKPTGWFCTIWGGNTMTQEEAAAFVEFWKNMTTTESQA